MGGQPGTERIASRQHENLLSAENSRIGRIYHSERIKQNGKKFCLFSDFNEIAKKVASAHKMKEHVTENFDVR